MAAKFKVLFTICIFYFFYVNGQGNQTTNETVTNTGSSSSCICDLIVDSCDVNCCCDVDCTSFDKQAFTECKESKNIIYDDRVCVSDQTIFIKNIPFKTENTGNGLLCILTNNNNDEDVYSDVSNVDNNADFNKMVNTKNVYSYEKQVNNIEAEINKQYKVGDKIMLLISQQTKAYLSLPTMFGSTNCNDQNPAGYLQDTVTSCIRNIVDISKQCSTLNILAAKNYYTGFQVAISPEAFLPVNISTNTNNTSVNISYFIQPSYSSLLLCRDQHGQLSKCSFKTPEEPVFNTTTKLCENVVTEVLYILKYSNDSTKLAQFSVSFVFENIPGTFVQKYSTQFSKEGSGDSSFKKSGNPGYLQDQPLLAGVLLKQHATETKAISLSQDKKDWLTIAKTSLDGSCINAVNERLSVTFHINIRSGCLIKLERSTDCSLLQDLVFSALLGTNTPEYVASFGNSDVTNAADWVKIVNEKPANIATGTNGVCNNMVLGLHIEVLFAKIGYLVNPQSKIVGVRFKYEQPKTLIYQCTGLSCPQMFEVVSSVAFIDISKPPQADYKSLPEFQSKAPADFFHPFL